MTLLFISILFLFSCEKFEEGGGIKKANEKIIGIWRLSGYSRNGVDETSSVTIRSFTETFSEANVYSRTYKIDSIEYSETGSWEMSTDNRVLNITGVANINYFSNLDSTLSVSNCAIIRLAKDELWYEFENNGNTHQFRMLTN